MLSNPSKAVLCVDIGGTSSKVGLLDEHGRLSAVGSVPTEPDAEQFVQSLCGLIQRTLRAATEEQKPWAIGIAIAGFLDAGRSYLEYNSNLSWLQRFPLKEEIAKHFELPIELEVDSNAACIAEYRFGGKRASQRFMCLTAGTGLGVGMTLNGEILRFAYGCMGDAGHIIVDRNGPVCSCGGRGCVEASISAPALAQRYQKASLRHVIAGAQAGDSRAVEILSDAGKALAVAAASLSHIFFPDQISIAGGLSAAGKFVMQPLTEAFQAIASERARAETTISLAKLGPDATLIGAAWPFWDRSPGA